MPEYIEIIFEGNILSKKNCYAQTKTGRRYKPAGVVETEKLCLSQIPAEYCMLGLEHPGVEFFAYIPKKSWALDVDGVFTTICDYLVKAGVIIDDCIRKFNGAKVLHVVENAERKRFVVRLYPKGIKVNVESL